MGVVIPGATFPIIFADAGAISAFGRVKVSASEVLFSSQQQYGDDTTVWESAFVGTGANTFLPNESTIQMSTGGTGSTASAIRQTRLFHRYTPGHGIVAFTTFCMDGGATVTNNTRRVGLFDASNGIFLEVAGSTVSFCQRTYAGGSASDANKVAQASWNVDKFNGTGPSGITIDWTKAQILVIDLQWLGVGRVRVGFDIAGVFYPAHYFNNANAVSTVYMTTANLPIRFENTNTGTASGTATLRHICTSVTTGGGSEINAGKQYCYNNGPAGLSISSAARKPVISVRAKTTGPNSVRNTGQIYLAEYDIYISGLNAIFWELVLNPTLTGASYTALNATNSIADVDSSATAVSGGTVLDSGLISGSASAKASSTNSSTVKQLVLSYSGLLNFQDVMTLVCTAVGGTAVAVCSLKWLEKW